MDECNEPPVNFFEEVKKLQDLVRKLELQNQELRSNQKHVSRIAPPGTRKSVPSIDNGQEADDILTSNNNNNNYNLDSSFEISTETKDEGTNYFDEIDIIKFSDAECSDDDSWLYTSPKGLTPEQRKENPYEWLRKDVDNPENKELQLAKTALTRKLNDLDVSHERKRLFFDTKTFTKSRKKQALDYLTSISVNAWNDKGSGEPTFISRGSDVSLDSSSGIFTLTDASDVHEVARMQEESLRMNSPVNTLNRTDSHSGQSSSVSRRSVNSFHSSPTESPYSSNTSLNNAPTEKRTMCRRSMPNLNERSSFRSKLPPPNKRHSASKAIVSGRKSYSNSYATSSKIKEPVQHSMPSQLPSKSGLPRPLSHTKPASSTWSRLPSSTSRIGKRLGEDTWSDGCF